MLNKSLQNGPLLPRKTDKIPFVFLMETAITKRFRIYCRCPMQSVFEAYFPILVFLCIASGLAIVMAFLPMIIGRQKPDTEKNSAYECGFEAFGDARGKFDVRFYLVAILFIIFDLEVAFLFPWAISLGTLGAAGFWSMMGFLFVLTVGFIYEWKKGALEWE
jgi:NADH-quinone oxidoreductase subunit A